MYKSILLALLAALSVSAYAQQSNINLGEGKNSIFTKALPDRITYFSIFSGPSFGDFSDPVDETGEIQEGSMNTWNQISFGWQVTKDTRVVVNPRFAINHNTVDPEEDQFELVSPVVGISSTWYKTKKFRFGGGLNTITPLVRQKSHEDDKRMFNPGGFNQISYTIDNKWSTGMWLWGRYKFLDRDVADTDSRFNYFYAPTLTYSFTDATSLMGFYQVNGSMYEDGRWENDEDDTMNVLFSYTVNKYLTLQPMITMYRESGFDVAKANFNMWLSGRIF